MIEIQNLCKSFGDFQVLKNINLKVEKGDVIAVVGKSGSGKTTLLRCMNFLEKADSGIMIFDDKQFNLSNSTKQEIQEIHKKTGFVFQNYNLFRNLTVLENVTKGLIVGHKINKHQAIETAKITLEKVGMGDRLNSRPHQLSGGQQQRVSIARALASNPEIIYFDEPTSALDPELIGEVLSVIKKLSDEGITMMVVTHELNFAKNISSRVIQMNEGSIIKNCSSEEYFKLEKSID